MNTIPISIIIRNEKNAFPLFGGFAHIVVDSGEPAGSPATGFNFKDNEEGGRLAIAYMGKGWHAMGEE